MARPKKQPGEKRSSRLPPVDVTEAERLFVERQARTAGARSLADYVRRRVLGEPVQPDTSVMIPPGLLAELSWSGNNLNQIARHMNSGRPAPPHLGQAIAEHRAVIDKLAKALSP